MIETFFYFEALTGDLEYFETNFIQRFVPFPYGFARRHTFEEVSSSGKLSSDLT